MKYRVLIFPGRHYGYNVATIRVRENGEETDDVHTEVYEDYFTALSHAQALIRMLQFAGISAD